MGFFFFKSWERRKETEKGWLQREADSPHCITWSTKAHGAVSTTERACKAEQSPRLGYWTAGVTSMVCLQQRCQGMLSQGRWEVDGHDESQISRRGPLIEPGNYRRVEGSTAPKTEFSEQCTV